MKTINDNIYKTFQLKRPGKIVEQSDGQIGIVYNDEPIHGDRLLIRLVDENMNPKMNAQGKKLISVKKANEVKIIGFVD